MNTSHFPSPTGDKEPIHIAVSAFTRTVATETLLTLAAEEFRKRGLPQHLVDATITIAGRTMVEHLSISFDPLYTIGHVAQIEDSNRAGIESVLPTLTLGEKSDGTGTRSAAVPPKERFRSFREARKFVHRLVLSKRYPDSNEGPDDGGFWP